MSSTPGILIYGELLSNIRQVSVIASLQTPSTLNTRATLSSDGLQLRLIHDDSTVLLTLPTQVAAVSSLQQPKLGSQEIAWRLALPSAASTTPATDSTNNPSAPWTASSLSDKSQVTCRKCRNPLFAVGSVQLWKDLPSQNWAEMMDFWHCHKPNIPEKYTADDSHSARLKEKGYGANNRFMARRGVGFVDLTYFLLSEEDCPGVKLNHIPDKPLSTTSSRDPIYCEKCGTLIGAFDQLASGLRLYKWSISISSPRTKTPPTYPLSYFLTAYLLSQVSSQAVNKFVLHSYTDVLNSTVPHQPMTRPTSENSASLHIWVFAPYLTISMSASGMESSKPIPASKIFYRLTSYKECTAILESASMTVEEIKLPTEVMVELVDTLRRSTTAMPGSARKFREWDVGFLERFIA